MPRRYDRRSRFVRIVVIVIVLGLIFGFGIIALTIGNGR
jgi:phage shock protein PspC (stress-responsive transcriptional regulator)